MRYGQKGGNNLGQYQVGGFDHSGGNSFGQNVRGTGYKGRNFDPNFHNRRNEGKESGYKGKNFDPNYHNRRGPGLNILGQGNSKSNFNPNYRNRGSRRHPGNTCSALPMLFITKFSEKVLQILQTDRDGDLNICSCTHPGETKCFYTISELYRNSLVNAAELQTELVRLLEYFMRDQAYVRKALNLFLEDNPDSILQNVLETMVAIRSGATTGQGIVENEGWEWGEDLRDDIIC
ncbi:hypothetical protein RRF57_006695 [Xylaria bambusicola]|uniref:Uncharacterized protein n=1 Tax=Xylaria bambusicola TaxID=326684 RepID=A0AAN7YZ50_9PEZI